MAGPLTGRRLLLLKGRDGDLVGRLAELGVLADWQVLLADSLAAACSLQQQDPCDVVLIEDASSGAGDPEQLVPLIVSSQAPVVVLADRAAEVIQSSPETAPQHWLPRQLIVAHPRLLTVVLQQAAHLGELQKQLRSRDLALQDCQQQVNRLVEMLSPDFLAESPSPWFTQRHMMERLYEEVTRSQRHGDALAVVLGEMTDSSRQPVGPLEPTHLAGWTAARIGQSKRRCDVAGQYGPRGFMLLLPHTGNQGAADCCRRLQPILEHPAELPSGAQGPLQVRFGIATFSTHVSTATSLLGRAEERLELARTSTADCFAL